MTDVFRILSFAKKKISVSYDDAKRPYFGVIVTESLTRIASKPVGKALLDAIGNTTPSVGFGGQNEHVKIMPTFESANFQVRGVKGGSEYETEIIDEPFKRRDELLKQLLNAPNANLSQLKGLIPSGLWGQDFLLTRGANNCHASQDTIAGENGTGSVATVYFSNAKRVLGSGLAAPPFIGLAHELVHALHSLQGTKAKAEEEMKTVGLGKYVNEAICENTIRAEHKLMLRKTY
jgi:Effector protein